LQLCDAHSLAGIQKKQGAQSMKRSTITPLAAWQRYQRAATLHPVQQQPARAAYQQGGRDFFEFIVARRSPAILPPMSEELIAAVQAWDASLSESDHHDTAERAPARAHKALHRKH